MQRRGLRGSRLCWSHPHRCTLGPGSRPSPQRLCTILGGVDPAPTLTESWLSLQLKGSRRSCWGRTWDQGCQSQPQSCRAAQCHMPTQPLPSTNLPTPAAWASSASEKVWPRGFPPPPPEILGSPPSLTGLNPTWGLSELLGRGISHPRLPPQARLSSCYRLQDRTLDPQSFGYPGLAR